MTTIDIDELFLQIISSEKAAQKRNNILQELKQNVYSLQEKLKNLQQQCKELHRKYIQKVSEQSNKELQYKWVASQQGTYRQQKEELQIQLDELNSREEEIQMRGNAEKIKFCDEMSQFSSSIGLSGCGCQERENEYKSELSCLEKEEEKLQEGLKLYRDRKDAINCLLEQKQGLQIQLEKPLMDNTGLTSSLCEELQKTSDIEEKRLTITNAPQTDDAFISLQKELEQEKNIAINLEHRSLQLQEQLQQLHQKLWQQQIQRREMQHHLQKQFCHQANNNVAEDSV